MKSSTVRHGLSSARRRPRPSCCRKTVALSVGRRKSTVSISGTSTPSLKRSTVKRTLTSRSRSERRARLRVSASLREREVKGRDAGLGEAAGHELGVIDADAEAQRPHAAEVGDLVPQLLEDQAVAGVLGRVEVGQLGGVVALAPLEAKAAQVDVVVHAEVLEGAEGALLDRLPETEVDGGVAVEPVADVFEVRALGGRRQPEQHTGTEMVQQTPVGRGHG